MPQTERDYTAEREALRRMYVDEEMSLREIGARLGVSHAAVQLRLERMGIARRPRGLVTRRAQREQLEARARRLEAERKAALAEVKRLARKGRSGRARRG